jgi:hypothetical protein
VDSNCLVAMEQLYAEWKMLQPRRAAIRFVAGILSYAAV